MADEKNWYLADLRAARPTVEAEIESLLGSGTTMESHVVTRIGDHGGWVCSEADLWITDLKSRCGEALTALNESLGDLDSAISLQAYTPEVPEGDWRGLAWQRSH